MINTYLKIYKSLLYIIFLSIIYKIWYIQKKENLVKKERQLEEK